MNRLTCKPQFVDKILDGSKTATCRARRLFYDGEKFAFVTRQGKRPAFLVKASDGFAFGRIIRSFDYYHHEFLPKGGHIGKHAKELGFDSVAEAREFYSKSLNPNRGCYVYRWELITKEEAMEAE